MRGMGIEAGGRLSNWTSVVSRWFVVLLFAAMVASAMAMAAVVFPACAWGAEGDVLGYAYLDSDENGDYTALVVQAVPRDEASQYVELGKWKDSGSGKKVFDEPWDVRSKEIRSARFESLASQPTGFTLSGLFSGCDALEKVDFGNMDTSKATDMSSMFRDCSSLASLDASRFDTSRVKNMTSMFRGCSSLTSIDVSGFDTSSAKNMPHMFRGCSSLVSIDVSGFDTSGAISLACMFDGCSSLASLDVSGFDTSKAADVGSMFRGCSELASLDVSGFDTSRATSMSYMFSGCSSLESLDVSGFDTTITDKRPTLAAKGMFNGCGVLCEITVGNQFRFTKDCDFPIDRYDRKWFLKGASSGGLESIDDLNSVIASGSADHYVFSWVFSSDSELNDEGVCGSCKWAIEDDVLVISPGAGKAEGTLGNPGDDGYAAWKKSKASFKSIRFEGMVHASYSCRSLFSGLRSVRAIDFEGFDTSGVRDMSYLFYGCSSLESLDVSGFDTSGVRDMSYLFYGCSSLKSLDLSKFDTSNVVDMSYMFHGCSKLESLDVSKFDTSGVVDMRVMFYGCSKLASLDVSSFDTSRVRDMGCLFYGCSSLESLDVSRFNTSRAIDMGSVFRGCSSLASLDVSGFDTSQADCVSYLFAGCSSLASLDVSGFDTRGVRDMSYLFYGCSSLASLDVSGFDTSGVRDMSSMFSGCSSLSSLGLPDSPLSEGADTSNQFGGCDLLRRIHVGGHSPVTALRKVLPGGCWQSNVDGAVYATSGLPEGVEAVYTKLSSSIVCLCASLDADGTLAIMPAALGSVDGVYWISEMGYESAIDVPWNDVRNEVKTIEWRSSDQLPNPSGRYRSLGYWFADCTNLVRANLSGAGLKAVDYSEMFRGCSSLESLDLSSVDTRLATSMHRMFHGCRSLASVTLGENFTFRGSTASRLPGGELPEGAWANEGDLSSAYASDSIPMGVATYVRIPDADLEDPEKGIKLISSRSEDDQGKPQLEVASTIVEGEDGAEEHLEYKVADDYAGSELYIGESPRAQALKFSSGKVRWNTVVSKVYANSGNYWSGSAIIGSRVKSIAPRAFDSAPNIRTLYVRSSKLKKRSKVCSCLVGSNVDWVWVSGMSSSNVRKVVNAFNSWAWVE